METEAMAIPRICKYKSQVVFIFNEVFINM